MKRDRNILLLFSYGLALLACAPVLILKFGIDAANNSYSYAPYLTLVWLLSAILCFRKSIRTGLIALIPVVPILYLNWLPILFLIAFPFCGHGGRCMDG